MQIEILLVLEVLIETPFGDSTSLHDAVDAGYVIVVVFKLCNSFAKNPFPLLFRQIEKCLFWHPPFTLLFCDHMVI